MLGRPDKVIRDRLKKLESHLERENPLLLDVVARFKKLDRIAYKMGLLSTSESYATRIPWWPLISILGTFSAGKSSFINNFLGQKLQLTGNQAVDDKFTVICYSAKENNCVLPGLALDADPRFPFYKMSDELEKVAAGEGNRIGSYLQMKTSSSESISGKIIIDSPGFDADDQRNTILKLTNHIIDLSDLVLVFFDARHPEPGAMQDTLDHLVGETIRRNDSEKFLYILNQIDTAAREDNPEDVVAAWQRAIAYKGLTAGRFYEIYNKDVAVPIADETVKKRFEAKCDVDVAAINERIHQVEVERSYRIIGSLEKISRDIENDIVPTLTDAMNSWKKLVLLGDAIVFGFIFALLFFIGDWVNVWAVFEFNFNDEPVISSIKAVVITAVFSFVHFSLRKVVARRVAKKLDTQTNAGNLKSAFLRNTRFMRSVFQPKPAGWSARAKRVLSAVKQDASEFIQTMNDRYANPSGQNFGSSSRKAEVMSVVGVKFKTAGD